MTTNIENHPIGIVSIEIKGAVSSGKTIISRKLKELFSNDSVFNLVSVDTSVELSDGNWGDLVIVSQKTENKP